MNILLSETAKNLNRRGFATEVYSTGSEAMHAALKLISPEDSVSVPGSMTVRDIGLLAELKARGNEIRSFGAVALEGAEDCKLEREADAVVLSANAITVSGMLVNIDGICNRISDSILGPRKVIFIAGRNKIVEGGYEEAVSRIKNVATPLNARRLGYDVPCAKTGKCNDCNSPQRLCRGVLSLECPPRKPFGGDYYVLLVDEDLGY